MSRDQIDDIAAHFGLSSDIVTSTPLIKHSPQTPCFVRFKSPVKNVNLKPPKRNLYEPIFCDTKHYKDPYFNVLTTSAFKEKHLTNYPIERSKWDKRSALVYHSIKIDFSANEETITAPDRSNNIYASRKKSTHTSVDLNAMRYGYSHYRSFKLPPNTSRRRRKTSRSNEFRSRRRRADDRRRKRVDSNSRSRKISVRFMHRRETLRFRNKRLRNNYRHHCERRHEENAPRYRDHYYRNEHKYAAKKDNKRYRSPPHRKPRRKREQ
ncbi:unnamed protein product [Rodentolepis nana]|uniref:Btz domain-containing protein n=1 Tax=Rodentolepis nana TaxID=102285 RepID=A0A0R3TSP6_RODNA|nr:unnamed protein product [Rodentolepis nana]